MTLALLFGAGVYAFMGRDAGLEFFAGYLIEKALSVDNIFVFVLIFGFFRVPPRYQHRVLFWGILGALVMRGAMIVAGAYLIQQFHWILYVFGAFLVFTGIRMATQTEHAIEPESNPVIRLVRRLVAGHRRRITASSSSSASRSAARAAGGDAAVRRAGAGRDDRPDLRGRFDPRDLRRHAGSVHRLQLERLRHPRAAGAVLPAGGRDPPLPLPQVGLSVVLVFVGAKMLVADVYKIPIGLSLGVVVLVLAARSPRRCCGRSPSTRTSGATPETKSLSLQRFGGTQ